jgi:hypothetical protein
MIKKLFLFSIAYYLGKIATIFGEVNRINMSITGRCWEN